MHLRFLAVWIVVLLCAETIAAQQYQRDAGYYALYGNVKSVSESLIINPAINEIPGNGDTVYTYHYPQYKYTFNRTAKLTESVEYFSDGSVAGISNYDYDSSGNYLMSVRFVNQAGIESRSIHFEYDSAFNLISEREFRYGDISESTIYRYNQKHQLVEMISYNHDGSLNRRTIYGYDKRGNMISQTVSGSNELIISREVFNCDKRGNIIRKTSYDARDSIVQETFYSYKRGRMTGRSYYSGGKLRSSNIICYDRKGNMTREIRQSWSDWSDIPFTDVINLNNGLTTKTWQYNYKGELIRYVENEYDSQNNLAKSLTREAPGWHWQPDNTIVRRTTFEYDPVTGISTTTDWFQDGNPYKIERHDSDSNLIEVLQYEHDLVLRSREVRSYDSKGRLREKVRYSDIDGQDTLSVEIFIHQTIENQTDTREIEAQYPKAIIHKNIYDLSGNISESLVMRRDRSVAELSVFKTDSTTGIKEEDRKWYNRDGTIQHHWTLRFDAKGNQLERGYWNSKAEFVPFETTQYDENNNVIEEVYYSYHLPSRTTKSITRRYYNDAGEITEIHRFDTRTDSIRPYGKAIYNYNSAGKVERISTRDRDDTLINQTIYNYDHEGRLVQISHNNFRVSPRHHHAFHSTITAYRYDSLGNLTHQVHYQNGTQVSEMIFEYDTKGNIIREQEYNDGILKSEKISKFDESGRRTEEVDITYLGEELDENGMINTTGEYRREYDAHVNWTTLDQIHKGKTVRRQIRAFEYYD